MQKFIDVTIKPVLIIGGIGTALAGLNAFFPRFAVENVQKLEWVPEYTIFVQHWGIMVCLMGVFMVAAAFKFRCSSSRSFHGSSAMVSRYVRIT